MLTIFLLLITLLAVKTSWLNSKHNLFMSGSAFPLTAQSPTCMGGWSVMGGGLGLGAGRGNLIRRGKGGGLEPGVHVIYRVKYYLGRIFLFSLCFFLSFLSTRVADAAPVAEFFSRGDSNVGGVVVTFLQGLFVGLLCFGSWWWGYYRGMKRGYEAGFRDASLGKIRWGRGK